MCVKKFKNLHFLDFFCVFMGHGDVDRSFNAYVDAIWRILRRYKGVNGRQDASQLPPLRLPPLESSGDGDRDRVECQNLSLQESSKMVFKCR